MGSKFANVKVWRKQVCRELSVKAGQAYVLRSDQAGRVESKSENSILVLQVDPDAAHSGDRDLYGLAGQLLPYDSNYRMLVSYLAWLQSQQGRMTAQTEAFFASQLYELLKLCSRTPNQETREENSLAGARIQLASVYIAQNYWNGDISEADVAENQGISVRYLQKLFEREGTSFTERLSEKRLQAAEMCRKKVAGDSALSQRMGDAKV